MSVCNSFVEGGIENYFHGCSRTYIISNIYNISPQTALEIYLSYFPYCTKSLLSPLL